MRWFDFVQKARSKWSRVRARPREPKRDLRHAVPVLSETAIAKRTRSRCVPSNAITLRQCVGTSVIFTTAYRRGLCY